MDTLKQTLKGVTLSDKFNVSFDNEAKEARNTHKVTVSYKFDNVTVEQALKPAIKKLNIKVQSLLRDRFLSAGHMAEGIEEKYEYDVAKLLAPPSREYDPMKAAAFATEKMSAEQLENFLKELKKRQKQAS